MSGSDAEKEYALLTQSYLVYRLCGMIADPAPTAADPDKVTYRAHCSHVQKSMVLLFLPLTSWKLVLLLK